jgi:DNA-binding MarR family transcriptional regulator
MPSRRKLAADAWGAVLRVHAAVLPSLDRELRMKTGLPLGWYDVLLELSAAPDGQLTMSELGQRAVLSRSRISRVVDELADAGLVSRTRHPTDGRSAFASLTAEGRARFEAAAPVYVEAIQTHFAAELTTDQLRGVRDGLDAVLAPRPAP